MEGKQGKSATGHDMGDSQELNVEGTSPQITCNVPPFL